VLYQRHTQRMIGGSGDDRYDLPGIAFPVYFTWSGVAIHGTYWHNDYGRRHSHGCVNVTNEAAQWVFRWTDPPVPYDQHTLMSSPSEGTRVVVVA
jgi:lipoprotein-anchoring transpeptidase ErfK/SrfK